jgi:hypothetical protein
MNGPEDIFLKDLNINRVKSTDLMKLTKVHLTSIFAFILYLVQYLRTIYSIYISCFFLNNLFLNINVLQVLLALRICCTGTTRKNAQGIPD